MKSEIFQKGVSDKDNMLDFPVKFKSIEATEVVLTKPLKRLMPSFIFDPYLSVTD